MMSDEIPVGAHLVTQRFKLGLPVYTHHGIYVGGGHVIHYAGNSGDPEADGEKIQIVALEKFMAGSGYWIAPHPTSPFTGKQIVERAHGRIGEDGYSVFSNNCEHFCNWVVDGSHTSQQVDRGAVLAAPAGGGFLGALGLGGITLSSAAGLAGGAALMNGAASVGVLPFLGAAVGGIATTGLAAGGVAAYAMRKTLLAEKDGQSEEEKEALSVGRAASIAGVAAGAAGTVAAISAAGTVSGLSAAGITSGLAAIGGTVGGGMATGAALGVAAPAVAAVSVGYGAYKLAQNHDGVRDGLISVGEAAGDFASKGAELANGAIEAVAPIARNAAGQASEIAKAAATKVTSATSESAPMVVIAAKTAAEATRNGLLSVFTAVGDGVKALHKKLDG
jgi:hypothetical protein